MDVAPRHIGKYHIPMSESLKQRLDVLFTSFNQKLFELLGRELAW
jgi:hypothetical protein